MSDGPKEVLSSMERTAGGILDATYPGQLPRNEQQISNFSLHLSHLLVCTQGITLVILHHPHKMIHLFILSEFTSYQATSASAMVVRTGIKNLVLICLQHKEWRVYTPQGSSTPQRRFGNVYYHCSVACVQSSWPSFSPASVVVPEDVNCKLLAVHKHLLNFNLGLFIP